MTKPENTVFTEKVFIFLTLQREKEERESEREKRPVIIWQTCRHSHWQACACRGQHHTLNNHFNMNLCSFCSAGTSSYVKQLFYEGVRIRACIICWHEVQAKNIKTGTLSFSSLPGSFHSYICLWPFFAFLVSLQEKNKNTYIINILSSSLTENPFWRTQWFWSRPQHTNLRWINLEF